MTELEMIREAYLAGGWIALAGVLVTLALRLYRREALQQILPLHMRWGRFPSWLRLAFVFAASLVASWFAAISQGVPIWQALLGALPVAVTAVGGHKATKALGHAHTERSLQREGLNYEPGSIRTALDVVFPMDHDKLQSVTILRERAEEARREAGLD